MDSGGTSPARSAASPRILLVLPGQSGTLGRPEPDDFWATEFSFWFFLQPTSPQRPPFIYLRHRANFPTSSRRNEETQIGGPFGRPMPKYSSMTRLETFAYRKRARTNT